MAERLRKVIETATILSRMLVCLAGVVSVAGASAQALPDPTRPPASLAHAQGESDGAAATSAVPALQSVIVGPNRKIAVINGQAVKLGDKYGEARVVKIDEAEVVLKNGDVLQTLKLFPSIEKKSAVDSAVLKSNKNRRSGQGKE